MLIAEAAAVVPEGRITPYDVGLWSDAQVKGWRRVVDFTHGVGSLIGVQLAHAGRKASTHRPWDEPGSVAVADGGWQTLGVSNEPFPGYAAPVGMTTEQVEAVPGQFAEAARRAQAAGFDTVEIHAAHGYLLHQFLSPLTNTRTDAYGGSARGRARLLLDVADAVREVWPAEKPLLVRVSATDWLPDGLDVDDVALVVAQLGSRGVDLVDVSTGGLLPAPVDAVPGYQLPHARRMRAKTGLPTAAVGLITEPHQAEQVLGEACADVVMIGRAGLREPSWPLRAAHELSVDIAWPRQLERGAW
jgi:2,4-dienoyl-CoA reductase-like NADH-dependent reductase (Old Yellow Enzyme family)